MMEAGALYLAKRDAGARDAILGNLLRFAEEGAFSGSSSP
jgi:hypothetical protein